MNKSMKISLLIMLAISDCYIFATILYEPHSQSERYDESFKQGDQAEFLKQQEEHRNQIERQRQIDQQKHLSQNIHRSVINDPSPIINQNPVQTQTAHPATTPINIEDFFTQNPNQKVQQQKATTSDDEIMNRIFGESAQKISNQKVQQQRATNDLMDQLFPTSSYTTSGDSLSNLGTKINTQENLADKTIPQVKKPSLDLDDILRPSEPTQQSVNQETSANKNKEQINTESTKEGSTSTEEKNDEPKPKTPEQLIAERAEFSWRHQKNFLTRGEDVNAYKKRIGQELEKYATEMSNKLGLYTNQRKILRQALSEGLMGQPDMLISVGRTANAIFGGVARLLDQKYTSEYLQKYGVLPDQETNIKGTDARAFDYRSTVKRLTDVMVRPPFDTLEQRLKLTPKQKEKLEAYSKEVIESLPYKARTLFDDTRQSLGKAGYTAFRLAMLAALVGGIYAAVKYVF